MRRAAMAAPIVGVLAGGFGAAIPMVSTAQPCAAATYSSHVTLVVEHGDARVVGLCIGFDGSSITGEQILQASGLEYATQSYGSLGDAVCQIDSEPTSYGACLPSSGSYWAMFVTRAGGGWQTADRGISTETFSDGDAEGFRYDSQSGAEPAPASPDGICARALATPSAAAPVPPGSAAGGPPPAQGAGTGSADSGPTGSAAAEASPPPAAPSPAAASQEPSVIRPAGSRSGVATVGKVPARAGSGPDAALLAACAGIAALAALLAVRLMRRRRVGRA